MKAKVSQGLTIKERRFEYDDGERKDDALDPAGTSRAAEKPLKFECGSQAKGLTRPEASAD